MAEPVSKRTKFPELESAFAVLAPKREVCRFARRNSSVTDEKIKEAVTSLLKNHPDLCPCFFVERLREEFEKRPFLVIGGRAVCLSKVCHPKNPQTDDCLTGELALNPFRCSQDHLFDQSTICFWTERNEASCPFLPEHPLVGASRADRGSVQEAQLHQEGEEEIRRRQGDASLGSLRDDVARTREELAQIRAQTQEQFSRDQERVRELTRILSVVHAHAGSSVGPSGEQIGRLITDGTKVGTKAVITAVPRTIAVISSQFATQTAMQVVRQAPKVAVFGIPVVGLGFGIGAGIYRLCKRQWAQASGEFLSGAASCLLFIPGLGVAVAISMSVLIDLSVASVDVYDALSKADRESVRFACQVLGIEFSPDLRKERVDEAFLRCTNALNPGTSGQNSDVTRDPNAAKSRIYGYFHWTL